MLVGVLGLFESKNRYEMFRDNTFELLYFNKRVDYFNNIGVSLEKSSPPFSSVYVCSGILPKQICFETIIKKGFGE